MKYQRERKLEKAKFTTSLSLKMSTGKINKQYQTNYSPMQKKKYIALKLELEHQNSLSLLKTCS